ncbi:hypothetical protein CKY01_12810 [Photorhabdus laumondii subsp. clarkei]|uniref:Uncharacterized protein n=1 Tax=Photorhabdus laumondii subsp. clarkei TaxID=2029685 RepID=A0A329VH91_9GAMM|nr:hypothetical protein CKY01_12810 [Photorhabdus laumondii subsp. clarkei]
MLLLVFISLAGIVYCCYRTINLENNFFREYKFYDKTDKVSNKSNCYESILISSFLDDLLKEKISNTLKCTTENPIDKKGGVPPLISAHLANKF